MQKVIEISLWYSTLTVFDPAIVGHESGNKVSDEYLKQGFSWRKGNVDFYTIDSLGIVVELLVNEPVKLANNAIWAVQVPFSVSSARGIGIENSSYSSESEGFLLIPPGNYAVIFEQGFMPDWDRTNYYGTDKAINDRGLSQWGRLWLNKVDKAESKILLSGSQDLKLCPHCLNASSPLKLNAEPLN